MTNERALIVAWLREQAAELIEAPDWEFILRIHANAIERGDHIPTTNSAAQKDR